MTKKEAIELINRYAPCAHWNWVELGPGDWLRCEDCGAIIDKANAWKYEQAAKDFAEAVDVLLYGES